MKFYCRKLKIIFTFKGVKTFLRGKKITFQNILRQPVYRHPDRLPRCGSTFPWCRSWYLRRFRCCTSPPSTSTGSTRTSPPPGSGKERWETSDQGLKLRCVKKMTKKIEENRMNNNFREIICLIKSSERSCTMKFIRCDQIFSET